MGFKYLGARGLRLDWSPKEFRRGVVLRGRGTGFDTLAVFGAFLFQSGSSRSLRGSTGTPRRCFSVRFSKCSYSHGASRLGVQKPSKNWYRVACRKLCFKGPLASKRSIFERSSFLLLKGLTLENVKMLLFHYSQLTFHEGLAVHKILRNPKIELRVMK